MQVPASSSKSIPEPAEHRDLRLQILIIRGCHKHAGILEDEPVGTRGFHHLWHSDLILTYFTVCLIFGHNAQGGNLQTKSMFKSLYTTGQNKNLLSYMFAPNLHTGIIYGRVNPLLLVGNEIGLKLDAIPLLDRNPQLHQCYAFPAAY